MADPGCVGNVVQLRRGVKSIGGGNLGEMTKEQARDALVDGFGSKRVRTTHKKRKGQELEKEGGESMGSLRTELAVKKEEAIAAGEATEGVLRACCSGWAGRGGRGGGQGGGREGCSPSSHSTLSPLPVILTPPHLVLSFLLSPPHPLSAPPSLPHFPSPLPSPPQPI